MNRHATTLIAALLAILPLVTACTSQPEKSQPPLLRDAAAIAALKQGGYVVYLRHGRTDSGTDSNLAELENCSTQRNLSGRGREETETMGAAIRSTGIPIAAVVASPFCRTRDTARIAFGAASTEPRLTYFTGMPAAQREATNAYVRSTFATVPPATGNIVLVGHGPPFDAATQQIQPREYRTKPFLNEGDAALLRPDGKGGYALTGHIAVKAWSQTQ